MNQKTRSVLKTAFIAMAVFTVSMSVLTVKNIIDKSHALKIKDDVELVQIDTLNGNISDDATVALISTDHGDLVAELYPQYAPNTVANFTELAGSGYYDSTYFYEIQKDIKISGGAKYNDGSFPDGYDENAEMIEPEITDNLWPLKGALLSVGATKGTMWNGQITYSGSQFVIPGSIEFTDKVKKSLEIYNAGSSKQIVDMFYEYGGTPNFSKQITVFGQIFDGFDVLDDLLDEKTDEKTLRPLADIEIQTVKVMTYADYRKNTD